MRYLPSLFCLFLPLLTHAAPSELPPELKEFLGAPPPAFEKKFVKPARQLRSAMDNIAGGKIDQAIKQLTPLSTKSEMAEHASFELAMAQREKKQFAKSTALATRILYEFPASPYQDRLDDLIVDNDCQLGLQEAKAAKGPEKRGQASDILRRCLQRTPWRAWIDREKETEALFNLLKTGKDPLFGPFVAELIQALPASAKLRSRIQKEIPDADLRKYADVARFRVKSTTQPGVKPLYPDVELFDKGMQAVLESRWPIANDLFKQMVADFPQSEHFDRALYWIARTEDAMGNGAEAKTRYEQIYNDYPLSYYGLQSALRLKRDLSIAIVPAEAKPETLQGSLMPRQAQSVWKLRALLEAGLLDQARMEAKALFHYRPGGATFGQQTAGGAALAGLLFHTAGYSLAAFSHAYAAISLDPAQLNTFTLDLIFPSSFRKQFDAASETTGINPLLLLSLSKQESAFLPNAISRANALGLMQLLLSTARDMESKVSREQLFDPETNTRIGSKYFQRLLTRFNGNIALALAGYNAGPSRASQWQKRMNEFEGMRKNFDVDTFIDTIPFTETRRYVASILRNYAWYKLLNKDGKLESVEELAFQWQKNLKENPAPLPVEVPVLPANDPVEETPPETDPSLPPVTESL